MKAWRIAETVLPDGDIFVCIIGSVSPGGIDVVRRSTHIQSISEMDNGEFYEAMTESGRAYQLPINGIAMSDMDSLQIIEDFEQYTKQIEAKVRFLSVSEWRKKYG